MSFAALSKEIIVSTRGKGTYEITGALRDFVAAIGVTSGVTSGQITVFVHT